MHSNVPMCDPAGMPSRRVMILYSKIIGSSFVSLLEPDCMSWRPNVASCHVVLSCFSSKACWISFPNPGLATAADLHTFMYFCSGVSPSESSESHPAVMPSAQNCAAAIASHTLDLRNNTNIPVGCRAMLCLLLSCAAREAGPSGPCLSRTG